MGDDERGFPSKVADERGSLAGFLDFQRATLAMKCEGLPAEQLKRKAVPPSELSLLGLVRHAAEFERLWFQLLLGGEPVSPVWPGEDGESGEWRVQEADADEAFKTWHRACEKSRAVVDTFHTLDDQVEFEGQAFSVRYVLTHLIEEYARHNGHADLLREVIDGRVGA